MQYETIACFYFPTTVALVDDSFAYLSTLRLKLANSTATILYQNPQVALSDLRQRVTLTNTACNMIFPLSNYDNDQSQSKQFDINFSEVYKQIYNPERFATISTALVDYAMPELNGLEFCSNLKNLFIRKIMLTGKASSKIAVEGFNQGIIDKFLIKHTDDNFVEIKNTIAQEQHNFFYNLTKSALDTIYTNKNHSPLADKNFLDLFYSLAQQINACEYYILDFSGSFMFLDRDANPTFLLIKPDAELEKYYQIAKDSEAPADILNCLKNRQKLPFLLTKEDYQLAPAQWYQHLYPATQLKTTSGDIFYYSIIKGTISNLNFSQVTSYNKFLQSLA